MLNLSRGSVSHDGLPVFKEGLQGCLGFAAFPSAQDDGAVAGQGAQFLHYHQQPVVDLRHFGEVDVDLLRAEAVQIELRGKSFAAVWGASLNAGRSEPPRTRHPTTCWRLIAPCFVPRLAAGGRKFRKYHCSPFIILFSSVSRQPSAVRRQPSAALKSTAAIQKIFHQRSIETHTRI